MSPTPPAASTSGAGTSQLPPELLQLLRKFADVPEALKGITTAIGQWSGGPPSQEQIRVGRDYDVLRGLLGRATAPRSLRMSREPQKKIEVRDPLPMGASKVLVESGAPAVKIDELPASQSLTLVNITDSEAIVRVEVLDAMGKLLAFGPRLAGIVFDPSTGLRTRRK